jgi:hypothetical protein
MLLWFLIKLYMLFIQSFWWQSNKHGTAASLFAKVSRCHILKGAVYGNISRTEHDVKRMIQKKQSPISPTQFRRVVNNVVITCDGCLRVEVNTLENVL